MKYKRYNFIGGSSNYNAIISSIWLFILLLTTTIRCSEFPERECCDPPPIYPPIPDAESNNIESPIEPILPTTTTSLSSSTIQPIIGRSGECN